MRAQLDLVNIWCVSEWNGLFQFILKVGGELVFDWSTGIALCTSPYFCHSDTANIGAYVAPRHTNHVCCSPIGTHSLTHQTILTIAISLRSIGPQVSMNLQCVPFLLSWHYFNWPFDKSFTLTPPIPSMRLYLHSLADQIQLAHVFRSKICTQHTVFLWLTYNHQI